MGGENFRSPIVDLAQQMVEHRRAAAPLQSPPPKNKEAHDNSDQREA